MKQKIQMTPDEFRSYVASEVESIRSEIERLRYAAEHIDGPESPGAPPEFAAGAGMTQFAARQTLPELHKV